MNVKVYLTEKQIDVLSSLISERLLILLENEGITDPDYKILQQLGKKI